MLGSMKVDEDPWRLFEIWLTYSSSFRSISLILLWYSFESFIDILEKCLVF